MKNTKIIPLLLLAILIFIQFDPVFADAAPPMNPPGGDVSPEGGTQVEMLAEQVIMDFRQSTDDSAKVSAWFLLHNSGGVDEQLKVRFPLNGDQMMSSSGLLYTPLIQDFTAAVGNKQLPTQVVQDADPNASQFFLGNGTVMVWSEFDVVFPAGQDVTLSVSYTFRPTEEASFAYVNYLMATGAGWKGPIGKADVILRFPYILNQYNLPDDYFLSSTQNGRTSTIRENELWIHWDNLEPTNQDNINLSIVQPRLWQDVLRYRVQVIATPDEAPAWVSLARAYAAALEERHGMFFNSSDGQLYISAFERALTLDPKNATFHLEFAKGLLANYYNDTETTRALILNEIATVLKLDPGNTEALSLLDSIRADQADLPTPGPFPTFSPPTPTLEPTPTILSTVISEPTSTPQQITAENSSTPSINPGPASSENQFPTGVSFLAGLILLAAGFGVGWFMRRRNQGGG